MASGCGSMGSTPVNDPLFSPRPRVPRKPLTSVFQAEYRCISPTSLS
jgi:hypothetical protein